jgi:hypothetical protein
LRKVVLGGLLLVRASLPAPVVRGAAHVPGESRRCDDGHVPGVRGTRRRAVGDLVAPVGSVFEVVGGQLVDCEPAAEAAAQIQDYPIDDTLIDPPLGGL